MSDINIHNYKLTVVFLPLVLSKNLWHHFEMMKKIKNVLLTASCFFAAFSLAACSCNDDHCTIHHVNTIEKLHGYPKPTPVVEVVPPPAPTPPPPPPAPPLALQKALEERDAASPVPPPPPKPQKHHRKKKHKKVDVREAS